MKARYTIPDFVNLYNLIPKHNKKAFVNMLGYKTCSGFSHKHKITDAEYEFLVRYTEQFDNTKSRNTILEYVPFDLPQVEQHYNALCILINSAVFHTYKDNQKEDLKSYRFNLKETLYGTNN